ncbi:dual specificity protein phosphatase 3-like [Ptychodera flava]|uniref:dual specificity protein phosphatase 3-like n=1 Tax=Ptychodera flava TaxID=63121 RepID=UPI003969F9C1
MAAQPDSAEAKPSCTVQELQEILTEPSQGMFMMPSRAFDEVWPKLYIGEGAFAENISALQRVGITHVLNTAQGKEYGHVNTNEEFYKDSGIKFKGIKATDNQHFELLPFWQETGEFIHSALSKEGTKVLVHCREGFSRSSSTVLAYLMMYHGMTAQEATRTVRAKREIGPNDGFKAQLCELNEQLLKEK